MCVDDTMLRASNTEESFLQVCSYLDRCARNGIVLNPGKFQFCQDTLEFAGLHSRILELFWIWYKL